MNRQLKRRSRCNSSRHCLDSCFTGSWWVKTGEMTMWRQMSDIYQVFCKVPVPHGSPPAFRWCST
ncbi:hypothetical protein HAX54_029081, partial [Datura stramonium]|nr:hypothetical protein [Datura stramonium]